MGNISSVGCSCGWQKLLGSSLKNRGPAVGGEDSGDAQTCPKRMYIREDLVWYGISLMT